MRANSLALYRKFFGGILAQRPMDVSFICFSLRTAGSGRRCKARLWIWLGVVFGLCVGCHTSQEKVESGGRDRYPAQWWAPVPTNGAPAWEIFPQDAGPGE